MVSTDLKCKFNHFAGACRNGDLTKARLLYKQDPKVLNMQDMQDGFTVMIDAILDRNLDISRWLLSLPGLDTNICDFEKDTALHAVGHCNTPLDIVIKLAKLSSWETVNRQDADGNTALDIAVEEKNIATALYLSWLGVECQEENRIYQKVPDHVVGLLLNYRENLKL